MIFKPRHIVFILCCFATLVASASHVTDSLLQVLSQQKLSNSNRIEILLQLSEIYSQSEPLKASQYGREAIALAQSENLSTQEAKAYYQLAKMQSQQSNYDSAIFYFQFAITLFNPSIDKVYLAKAINERGIAYENTGFYTEAFQDYLSALKIYESINDKIGIANEYINIGLIHYYKKEFKKAEGFLKNALSISRKSNYSNGVASALNNLGMNENERGNAKQALAYFKQVLVLDEKDGNLSHIAYSLNNIGTAYQDLNEYSQALQHYYKSAEIKRKQANYLSLSNTYTNIASIFIPLRDFKQAQAYLDSASMLNRKYNFKNNETENLKNYYKLAFAQKNYENALSYYKQYVELKDSIGQQENGLAISKLEAVYDLGKAKIEIEDSKKDLKIARYLRYVSAAAILLLVCLSVYFYFSAKRISALNKLLNDKQAALVLAKDEAENATNIKSQFLSIVSHEIRTPLNAIIGVSNLLQDESTEDKQQENINVLKSSSQHLLHLINDLLDLNKLELGKMQVDSKQMNIRKISESILSIFSVSASQKEVELQSNIDSSIPNNLLGDDIKLTQALTNLLANAVKFTDVGIVRLSVSLINTNEVLSTIRFSVEDTGIGINESEQQSVFESFTQSNTNKKHVGSGLGLSISKRLVEVMGGEISLLSKSNQGSIFSFELTFFHQQNQSKPASAVLTASKQFSGKRILIAEDNSVNVFVLKQFLQKWDAQIDVAENGEEAINLLKEKPFDLVLMDVQMPVKDGIIATQEIRASNEVWKNIPIIAITASHETDVKEKVLLVGMNDYIIKPFEPEELFEKLAKQL